jgi:hypothetical protein
LHWPWLLHPAGHGPGWQGIVQKSPPLAGNGQQSFEAQSAFCVHAAPNWPAAASGTPPVASSDPPPSPQPGP